MDSTWKKYLLDKSPVTVRLENGKGGVFIHPTVVMGIGNAFAVIPSSLLTHEQVPFIGSFKSRNVFIEVVYEAGSFVKFHIQDLRGNVIEKWALQKSHIRELQESGNAGLSQMLAL